MSNTPNLAAILPLTEPDLLCIDDLDAGARETRSDLETLEQDIYHLLIERKGTNIDDVNRGIGVEDLLSGTVNELQAVKQEIESQLQEDSRIAGVVATILLIQPGGYAPDGTILKNGGYALELDVQPDPSVAPSPLSLSYYFASIAGLVRVTT